MKTIINLLKWSFISISIIIVIFLSWFYIQYGGNGKPFDYSPSPAILHQDSVEIVAELPEPPGNIAVSADGRIFCTYHAEGRPDIKVWEWVDGKVVPFPDLKWQSKANGKVFLDAIFNIRIDSKNRLWTLDHGQNGLLQPRLLAFDITTRQLVEQIDLPNSVAGIGSYVQDMNIDTLAEKIYIADLSAFGKKPALIVVDIKTKTARRLLENHESVVAEGKFKVVNQGREMRPVGPFYHFHPGLDPIALDRKNEYLYFGPMSGSWMYRVKVKYLNDTSLDENALASKVEKYAQKPQCDGITMDDAGNMYITSIEDGSVAILDTQKNIKSYVSHPKMRWPDGMSFGPDGYVYLADSDIPDVMMKSKSHMKQNAPYYIFRFKALSTAMSGQ